MEQDQPVISVVWLLYVSAGLTITYSAFCPHSVFVCFVWIWEQTAIFSLYSINWMVYITETESVYCAVRTGSVTVIPANLSFQSISLCSSQLRTSVRTVDIYICQLLEQRTNSNSYWLTSRFAHPSQVENPIISPFTPPLLWDGLEANSRRGVECLTLFNEYDEIWRDKESEYLLRVSL